MNTTIFDKIIAKEIDANVVFENEYVLSFKDVNPQAPIHILVLPKIKAKNMNDTLEMQAEYLGHFWHGIVQTATTLGLLSKGYRVVINNGKDAMQSVDYLHAHILAGRQLQWPPG